MFRGTPPAKPLDCKIRPNSSGALSRDLWADPTGGEPRLSRPSSVAFLGRTSASCSAPLPQVDPRPAWLLRRVDAVLCFVPGDIIKTSVSFVSQCYAFRFRVLLLLPFRMGKKNPASVPVSRVKKSYKVRLPAYLSIHSTFGVLPTISLG